MDECNTSIDLAIKRRKSHCFLKDRSNLCVGVNRSETALFLDFDVSFKVQGTFIHSWSKVGYGHFTDEEGGRKRS